jgi:NAD(P)-dependent dehydrogenase (short-subunit alcohol dehydrogenase family)
MESMRLDGRAAIVTGAGRGLGRAMAKALAQAGARVVCAARTEREIDETAAQIMDAGGAAIAVQCDVTQSAQVDAVVARCAATYGHVDIMVANAGGGAVGHGDWSFWDYPDAVFDAVIATNLTSNFYCCRSAAAAMVKQGGGSIINIASGMALRGNRSFAYPTAKAGVIALTKSAATMLGAHNIRVNVIVPGFVLQRPPVDEREAQLREQRGRRIPLQRVGEWWEMGPLAVYLASDASSYITGQSFIVDGGGLAGGLGPADWRPHYDATPESTP